MYTKNLYIKGATIIGCCFYLFSFKNPLGTNWVNRIFDDSTYFKLTAEQKRMNSNAMAGLIISDSLQATLFAAEPEITNPTNMDIDAKGRIWICEGFNYRPMLNEDKTVNKDGDRIVILEDVNGDGVADKTKVFYQGNDINAALGILVLGNKVIVSSSPYVFVFTDEDGDDKADKKEILFQGIGGEQHDHAIHAFVFGPDGKLYFNFGNAGEQLLDKNNNPVKDKYGVLVNDKGKPFRQGMVIRCNIDGSDLEVLGHNFRNNYEVSVDAFGTLWQSDNDDDGNKSIRINYVMEYGNYGYTDELTGAGWSSTRANMEKEINRQHWHQNDPGVVPNMLITGAGSPTGILVYEGELLPKVYQNQIIHTDAGPKVVRAYPTTKNGAGYNATMVNLIEGKDDWFRPSDLCVAPDGSLFVADWYDAGVGGHQRADLTHGRIYRVTTAKKPNYKTNKLDVSSPETAVEALKSPNMATRYLAWNAIKSFSSKAEKPLYTMLSSSNARFRARAYWALVNIEGKSKKYIAKALTDVNEDVRIVAIRMARQTEKDYLPILQKLAKDNSPQIRREVAIALRHLPYSAEAANLWADLALQYDGKDRWYLEALGIGAHDNWKSYFAAWKAKIGNNWNSPAGKDIVWRARTPEAMALLSTIISDANTPSEDIAKYFRAFDYHSDSVAKRYALLNLLTTTGINKSEIIKTAVPQFRASDLPYSTTLKKELYDRISNVKGSKEYVELVNKFRLTDQNEEIYNQIITNVDTKYANDAMKVLVGINGFGYVKNLLVTKPTDEKIKLLDAMVYTESTEIFNFKTDVILDEKQDIDVRKAAIRSFSWGWDGQDVLLQMIKDKKFPKSLEPAAANLFIIADRSFIREEASKYIKIQSPYADKPMPVITELTKQKGDMVSGLKVYNKYCLSCHALNGKGINFGPGLSEIGSKFGKDGLYLSILLPDAGVSFGYEGYIVKLKAGGGGAGIITSQTETDLELKMMGGIINKMKQSDILEKKKMDRSLMPGTLYASMSDQQLIDLVEYLSTLKKVN